MHIFTLLKYRFLGNVFFHAVIYGKTHVIQSDVFGVMGVKTVYCPFRQAASHTGAQIKNALRPVSALLSPDRRRAKFRFHRCSLYFQR